MENIIYLSLQILKQTRTMEKFQKKKLVLGSAASGKTTLVQEIASNSLFRKLEGTHWVSTAKLSKAREAGIDSCFEPKVEFYNPQDEDLRRSFTILTTVKKLLQT